MMGAYLHTVLHWLYLILGFHLDLDNNKPKNILSIKCFHKMSNNLLVGNNILNVKLSAALYYICMIRRGDGVEPILVFRVYLRLFPLTGFH